MTKSIIPYTSNFNTNTFFEDIEDRLVARMLTHYASQLLDNGLHDEVELEKALHRAVTALAAANLPATKHFRSIFISDGKEIQKDFLVSDLCFRLMMLNGDVSNPAVASLQIKVVSNELFNL
jgi:hypothetical protein